MYRDFIGMYQNVLEEGTCEHLISEFEEVKANGMVQNRQQSEGISKTKKQDEHFFLNLNQHQFRPYKDFMVNYWINKGLQESYDKYANEYDVLRDINIISTCIKMQKSTPGSGYHVWHAEQGNGESSARVLTWILYLNDVEEAGETEFLYQKLRIPPKKNSLVIWPAAYTHAHRGNVVHGKISKYILTGWFYAA